ncbi:MAG: hypothetical protein WBB65_10050 [Anaerolineales bacterium]
MEKIRSWPRWLQYGLLSAAAAAIFFLVTFLFPSLVLFYLGVVAPPLYLYLLAPSIMPESFILNITLALGFWFLFGAILGKYIRKFIWAAIIWQAALLIMGFLAAYFASLAMT